MADHKHPLPIDFRHLLDEVGHLGDALRADNAFNHSRHPPFQPIGTHSPVIAAPLQGTEQMLRAV